MRFRKNDIIGICFLVFATLLSWACLSARQCAVTLTVTNYSVPAEQFTAPVRIVHLSDLHSHTFGKDNASLAEAVSRQQPDLIVMTGDMLDRSDTTPEVICNLIRSLQDVAPVYYCYGNHEKAWMSHNSANLTPLLSEAGAVVLDTAFTDITVNGQILRIGGFHGYYRYWGMLETTGEEPAFADDFESTDCFKLLLDHIPTGWVDWGKIDELPVDLVLSGHYHGGQIRLPLLGGLYAPYMGFFPDYTEGLYAGKTATAIISAGLGSSPGIPRINNLPQIVVVDLIPKF